jgi:hypothetical protein
MYWRDLPTTYFSGKTRSEAASQSLKNSQKVFYHQAIPDSDK